ncbi:gamma-glutamyltransferase [Cryomorpha ignava]|uniref:Glutathione hydrolase proenzyme n=1 Tax=Cryomorpha ignava TaxID=101383 RepID=A0A7K3WLG7_9FLAO|nr:gamma-glutamyltransferase [Cryomorpha ignava]NEN22496.1 gamma-glutamyltransferase [Cryomorpha ignava]
MKRLFVLAIGFFLFLNGSGQPVDSEIKIGKSLDSLTAAVACAHPEAARIGAEILKQGGNAIDAAVGIQWALAVCYPQAGNIGGGGFMVIRMADGTTNTLDFREQAPAAATEKMYQDENGEIVEGRSLDTHMAVGVPGSVSGLYESHRKYGKLPMEKLIAPAIDLAENGFKITANQASLLNQYKADFEARNKNAIPFFVTNKIWKEGDLIVQSNLAATLKRISKDGEDEFYSGRTAGLIIEEMKAGGGIITKADLANYKSIWRKPIESDFENYKIISMPPPSSGGVAIVQLLKMWEAAKTDGIAHNSVEYLHLITEMERRVYADRSVHLGDPEFYKVPVSELLDQKYLNVRMGNFDASLATPSKDIEAGKFQKGKESTETTHLCVVDAEGNAVSVTTTLNGHFGSKIMVVGAGFFLNNEMDDFSSKPGTPNMFGLIGGEANSIQPEKRMLSSMTPTIVEKDGNLFLVAGSPGGSTIITSVFQTVMNTAVFDMNLKEAIEVPKFHSQWLPDVIFMEENRFEPELLDSLKALGHEIDFFPSLGRVDAILVNPNNTLQSCGDPRADDTTAGY